MSIKRFVAPNGREALGQVRRELGDDALVLSTRKLTGGRVEVLAVGPDEMQSLIEDASGPRALPARVAPAPAMSGPAKMVDEGAVVHAPSSGVRTESFEQFLQRQAQRQAQRSPATELVSARAASSDRSGLRPHEQEVAENSGDDAAGAAESAPMAAPSVFRRRIEAIPAAAPTQPVEPEPLPAVTPCHRSAIAQLPLGQTARRANEATPASTTVTEPAAAIAPVASPGAAADARLLAELQSMRALLLEQMATMSTANSAAELHRRSPMQVRAMTRLLTAGFSPDVARNIAERAPAAATPTDSDRWLVDVLALNVRSSDADSDWLGRGGVYALVGPTGVGKTTTVAKLAARFAVSFGAQALGLITLDAFRVGAHEQLRTYGRILGTPVHLAQDMGTLRDLLASMAGKRLVLIDTCGVSQRDERLYEMLEMLEQAGDAQRPIQRLLLLNAASHAETLDDVARAWQARQCAGALLTKLDEAARIGGALDCVLRHKLTVLGATNGQRVPEDWLAADSRQLASAALQPGHANFTLAEAEGAVLAAHARQASLAVAP